MAGAKQHDYHILPPSIWPFMGSVSAFILAIGAICWMHPDQMGSAGPGLFGLGLAGVLATFFFWWSDVVKEAHAGDHTPVVQLHLRYGMILFIASEVMFFVGWFWAFFDFALFPSELSEAVAGQWPPKAVEAVRSGSSERVRTAAAQHFDPALLGHHRHLGASFADPR